jgi:hypothetical protein
MEAEKNGFYCPKTGLQTKEPCGVCDECARDVLPDACLDSSFNGVAAIVPGCFET